MTTDTLCEYGELMRFRPVVIEQFDMDELDRVGEHNAMLCGVCKEKRPDLDASPWCYLD